MVYLGYRFRTELRAGMFWLIGICVYAGMIVTIYPSVRNAIDLSELPLNLRLAFNLADFTELAGFLSAQLLGVILPILLPFFGMISLSFVVAGAEERGRLDLVLANPLPRRSLVLASWIVAAVWLLLIALATGLTIVVVAQARGVGIPFWTAIGATFTLWPISLAFSSLALLLSCLVRQRSTALGVAGADERGRLDLVLANPLPRRSLVVASWIVTAAWLLLISLATGLTIVVVAQARGVGIPFWTAIGATFSLWPISLAFSSLALLLSCLVRQRSTALGVAGALVLISYLDLVIGRLVSSVGWMRYISAFNYYGTAAITGVWWGGVAVLLTASLILLLLAVIAFDRRDIYA